MSTPFYDGRPVNYVPPMQRRPKTYTGPKFRAPAQNPYEGVKIDMPTYQVQPVQQTQDEGWGSILGGIGGGLLTGYFKRKQSPAVGGHQSAPHSDQPIIIPHTGGGDSREGHEAAFAHGGYAAPRLVGKPVLVGEFEDEVAIDEQGNVQLLRKGTGTGILTRPAAIVPVSKLAEAYEQSGRSPYDDYDIPRAAAQATQPTPYDGPQFNLQKPTAQPEYNGPKGPALPASSDAQRIAAPESERASGFNHASGVPTTERLPVAPPVASGDSPPFLSEKEGAQLDNVIGGGSGRRDAAPRPAPAPGIVEVMQALDRNRGRVAELTAEMERDRAGLDPASFARAYPGAGKSLNPADVLAHAERRGWTPQRAALEAVEQGYSFDSAPLEIFKGQPPVNEFAAPSAVERLAPPMQTAPGRGDAPPPQEDSDRSIIPASQRQDTIFSYGINDAADKAVFNPPAPDGLHQTPALVYTPSALATTSSDFLYPDDDKYMRNDAARVGAVQPVEEDFVRPEDDKFMRNRAARSDYGSTATAQAVGAADTPAVRAAAPVDRTAYENRHAQIEREFAALAGLQNTKAVDKNGRLKSAFLGVLRVFLQGGGLVGAAVGGIRGAVSPEWDEELKLVAQTAKQSDKLDRMLKLEGQLADLERTYSQVDATRATASGALNPNQLATQRRGFANYLAKFYPNGYTRGTHPDVDAELERLQMDPPPALPKGQGRGYVMGPGQVIAMPKRGGGFTYSIPVDASGNPLPSVSASQKQMNETQRHELELRLAEFNLRRARLNLPPVTFDDYLAGGGDTPSEQPAPQPSPAPAQPVQGAPVTRGGLVPSGQKREPVPVVGSGRERRGRGGRSAASGSWSEIYDAPRLSKAEIGATEARSIAAGYQLKAAEYRSQGREEEARKADKAAADALESARVNDEAATALRAKKGGRRASDRPASAKPGDPLGILN